METRTWRKVFKAMPRNRSSSSGSLNALSTRTGDTDKLKIFEWIVREKDDVLELTVQRDELKNLWRNL